MKSTGGNRGGHPHGQPISPVHAQKRDEGLKQYWQNRKEAGQAPMSLHVADKISESLKRYQQEQKKYLPPEQS